LFEFFPLRFNRSPQKIEVCRNKEYYNRREVKKTLQKVPKMQNCVFVIFVLITSFVVIGSVSAQDKDEEVIRVETQLVNIPVSVTDKNGKPILNLNRENFIVYEDGVEQQIESFTKTTEPFEIALLLDTSGSTRNELALIRRAAESFISSLRKSDKVAIVAFQTVKTESKATAVPEILTKLTDDPARLKEALTHVKTSNGTPYYDAMIEILDKIFPEEPKEISHGRRAIVALTDGVDSVSLSDFDEVKERVQQKGIVTYFIRLDTRDFFEEGLLQDCETASRFSIAQLRRYYKQFGTKSKIEKTYDFCSLGYFERLAISKKLYEIADSEMQTLAKESGGKVFPAVDLNEARLAFKQIADEISTSYTLGYYSSNEKHDGTYRKIKVEVKGIPADSKIRAREGYVAQKAN
jgi:Ca-activated chloride channel homolog